ncbi:MAG: 16S rRNA (uracil(1498)-N(3))-methyltransferase [Alphaproteobacteria bacterium]|nr:16S rRNA (uracil(1498)-N(3))-methyltransferase [Alphaproteobacteria bacterium]
MIRIFANTPLGIQKTVELAENQVHYLLHVMRQKEGDKLILFNGVDGEWQSVIGVLNKKRGSVQTEKQLRPQEAESRIILCPALIKKENMDLVLQKATELGVSEIFPLVTERTVVAKLNLVRAQSIVTEAAEQCERLTVPVVHEPVKLAELWSVLPTEIQVVCLAERGKSMGKIKGDFVPALCVGPEGGWTDKELALFERKGAKFWHFGHTILRAETASIVALACFQK